MRSLFHAILIAAALAPLNRATAAEPPVVVASIKPVHALVAAVMADAGKPRLLLGGAGSPHTYALKPSDARLLAHAGVVFWVGADLESFLARPLRSLAADARVVALATVPGVTRLRVRAGGIWEPDAHAHPPADGPPRHGETDMHLWLDPANAAAMTDAIADTLAAADPARARLYRANAAAEKARLAALDEDLGGLLRPLAGRRYIVFHDAYQYLEHRYGLTPAGAVSVDPGVPPGAARISEIRRKIRDAGVACVFAEPQFRPGLIATVLEGSGARAAVLDPLGADLAPGAGLYFTLMRGLADALRDCLVRSP